jgi:hypothetical protein
MRDELAGKFSKDTAAANVVMLMQRLVHLGFFAHGDKVANPLLSCPDALLTLAKATTTG